MKPVVLHSYLLWRSSVPPTLTELASARYTAAAALLPALMVGLFVFGWYAGLVVLTALVAAFAADRVAQQFSNRWIFYNPAGLEDGTWLLTGMLIGLLMPPHVPLWIPLLGAVGAIFIGKHWASVDGMPLFMPAAVALLGMHLLFIPWLHPTDASGQPAWPVLSRSLAAPQEHEGSMAGLTLRELLGGDVRRSISRRTYRDELFASRDGKKPLFDKEKGIEAEAAHGPRPLDVVKAYGNEKDVSQLEAPERTDWIHLVLGCTPSCIGGSSALALGFGVLLIIFTGAASWVVPFFALLALGFGLYVCGSKNIGIHLLSGYTLLGFFFLAADPATIARSTRGKIIAGLAAGLVELLLRKWTGLSEASFITPLCVQVLSYPLDQKIAPPKEEPPAVQGLGGISTLGRL